MRSTRRRVLQQFGVAAVSLSWVGGKGLLPPRTRREIRELAQRFRESPSGEWFQVASAAIADGASPEVVLGAAYLTGVQEIAPRPVGNTLHAVLMVESSFLLQAGRSDLDAWRLVFWNLNYLAECRTGRSVLPPRPSRLFENEAVARQELVRAMDAWDPERADRAAVSLCSIARPEVLFETLAPYASRSSVDLGHKAVIAAHTERLVARIGWDVCEPAIRGLVRSLLHTRDGARFDQAHRSAVQLAGELRTDWQNGENQPRRSWELFRAMQEREREPAQQEVVAALNDGLGLQSVWDALRLSAHDVVARRLSTIPTNRGALGPVHAATSASSLASIFRRSPDDATRRVTLLSTVGWIRELHAGMIERKMLRRDSNGLLGIRESTAQPVSLDALFQQEAPTPAETRSALRGGAAVQEEFVSRVRAQLARKAVETHQHKYAAALIEDAARAHPLWRADLLALATPYLPNERDPETEVHERSIHALRRAGVIS